MNHVIKDVKLLIFDLDGTLYEDTNHFDYYGRQLQQRVPTEVQEEFWDTYLKMKKGEHPVQIGKVYDIKNDAAVTVDPMTLQVTAVASFDGKEWTKEEIASEYKGEFIYDFTRLIAIGDGWWLPYATAIHFGVKQQETWECYNKTKEYMVSEEFSLTKTPGLKEALSRLKKDKRIVLLTNSEREDVGRLLKELQLDGLFHEIYTEGHKPLKTREKLQEIMASAGVEPHEAVSIGDNFINEIAPALMLGLKAIYIHPNTSLYDNDNLHIVPTLAHAFQ